MIKKISFLLIIIAIIIGCSKPPQEELQEAEAAIQKAKESGSLQWAPDLYKTAESKYEEGKSFIEEKNYEEAKLSLIEAKRLAEISTKEAGVAKELAEAKRNEEAEQLRLEQEKKREQARKEAEKLAREKAEEEARKKELAKIQKYTVQKGDCLWKIARKYYNNPLLWRLIYEENKDIIKNPDFIRIGLVLTIPRQQQPDEYIKESKYLVLENDNLWTISTEVSNNPLMWKQIYSANKDLIQDSSLIYVGQIIKLPKNSSP